MKESRDFYEKIVESQEDAIGHIAYSICIQRKLDILERQPDIQDKHYLATVQIADLRKVAKEILDASYSEYAESSRASIMKELEEKFITSRLDRLQELVSFPWFKSIFAGVVASLIVPVLLIIFLYLFSGKAREILEILTR